MKTIQSPQAEKEEIWYYVLEQQQHRWSRYHCSKTCHDDIRIKLLKSSVCWEEFHDPSAAKRPWWLL